MKKTQHHHDVNPVDNRTPYEIAKAARELGPVAFGKASADAEHDACHDEDMRLMREYVAAHNAHPFELWVRVNGDTMRLAGVYDTRGKARSAGRSHQEAGRRITILKA
ncbi:MAG: hypothetical protein OXQ29_26360 [Rhodospirillaceae bacterium]|nr:hypothetical protein [Rhodospirillaceae bacterium]